MKKKIFLYLASQSERRRHLLRKMGIPFRVVPSRYREPLRVRGNPAVVVMRHALGKAHGAQLPTRRHRERYEFVLGADTLVFFHGRLIGKPETIQAAERLLLAMSGKTHWVYTGLALSDLGTGRKKVAFDKTKIRFKKWDREQIRACLKRVNPLDKAGAYAVQDRPNMVESYKGSLSNVVGLPIELLRRMLQEMKSFPRKPACRQAGGNLDSPVKPGNDKEFL